MILTRFRFYNAVFIVTAMVGSEMARADFNRAVTSGVVYPTISDSANLNPSNLMDEKGAGAGRLDYNGDTYGYSVGYGKASSQSGFGIVLDARSLGTLTVGAGTTFGWLQTGVNFNLNHTYNPIDGDIGVSLTAGQVDGWRGSVVLSSILKTSASSIAAGLGFAKSGKYQVEFVLKVLTSAISSPGENYTQKLMVVRYFSSFGLGAFEESKASIDPLGLGSLDFGGVLQFNMNGTTSIDVRYSSASDGGLAFGIMARL